MMAQENAQVQLAEIGYKQELKRTFSTIQVFGIAFSIMGLLPSIATTMSIGLTSGSIGLVWGWFLGGAFILTIGIGMSELSSSIPTSGGLYYWTHYYGPMKFKNLLSFVIGCSNTIALAGSTCSITYGFAHQVLAAALLGSNGSFEITDGEVYGVFAAGIFGEMFITCFASSAISKLQTASIIANCLLIIIFFIALPIGTAKSSSFNNATYIFGHFENHSDWNDGWTFMQFGLLPAIWSIGAFDSCLHMCEEVKTPSKSVPIGIIGSITVCWILGFLIMIVISACMTEDVESLINTDLGQPLAQVFYDSMGAKWAIAFMSLCAFCQFLMGASILTAIS